MPIIVNLDVMMAKRKISLGEHRKSQSGALLHAGSHLQGTELPARRHTGIPGGRITDIHHRRSQSITEE